jgi:serine/threonine protein kinase
MLIDKEYYISTSNRLTYFVWGTRAKLSDFGLATNAASSLTASGAGSPVYCAPEVINDNKTTAQTDIFAAGITLFQMANNISNLGALVSSLDTIKFGRVIPSIGHKGYVPRRLRYICNKACAFDPARRYSSADEMRQALERLHVKQDWTKPSAGIWQANVNGQAHEMTVDTAPTIEMVYKINARRRNANCKKCATIVLAEVEQDNWVYKHTF